MRAVLFGNNVAAIRALDVLRRHRIETVVVAPFRGPVHSWHASLYDYARDLGVAALYDPHSVNSPLFISELSRYRPDFILSVYYNQLFDTRLLALPRIGCFNLHPSLLPRYRGVAPLIWAILNHERRTGMTLHWIDEGVDTGPIVLQKAFPISPKDTGYTLHLKAARKAGVLVDAFCRMLEAGRVPRLPQRGAPSYFSKDLPPRNAVRWTWPRRDVLAAVRALTHPLPGAYAGFEGERVLLLKAEIPAGHPTPPASAFPGTLWWDARRRALLVQCADAPLALVRLHAGGRDLTGAQFRARALTTRATARFGTDTAGETRAARPRSGRILPLTRADLGPREERGVIQTVRKGWIGSGTQVAALERACAEVVETPRAVAVNAVTSGLALCLKASGIGPGDEVVVPAFAFCGLPLAVLAAGAKPVFADVLERDLTLDAGALSRAASARTRAVILSHFGGAPASQLTEIEAACRRDGWTLVQEAGHAICARRKGHALGRSAGPVVFGLVAGGLIDAGGGALIACPDEAFADRLRLLRNHGLSTEAWQRVRHRGSLLLARCSAPGQDTLLNDLQAAVALPQLEALERRWRHSHEWALAYDDGLDGTLHALPHCLGSGRHGHGLYVTRLHDGCSAGMRDHLVMALRREGIGAGIHHEAAHLHPLFRNGNLARIGGGLPVSERASRRVVSLPLFPSLRDADVRRVCGAVRRLFPQTAGRVQRKKEYS